MNPENSLEIEKQEIVPKPVQDLLNEHRHRVETGEDQPLEVAKVIVEGFEGDGEPTLTTEVVDENKIVSQIDYYNPTKELVIDGKILIFIRTDRRKSEVGSTVISCEKIGEDKFCKIKNSETLVNFQDPSYAIIKGEVILSAVNAFEEEGKKDLSVVTRFFSVNQDFTKFLEFAKGPLGMKDIRLIDRKNGKIGVFTRPQGGEYGPGQVGYFEIDDLAQLEEGLKDSSRWTIIQKFAKDEWGGVNDAYLLENGMMLIIGHIAKFNEEKKKEYYATAAIFNPETYTISHLRIIFSAEDVHRVRYKQDEEEITIENKFDEQQSIIFAGGLNFDKINQTIANFYAGVGDTGTIRTKIPSPLMAISEEAGIELKLAA